MELFQRESGRKKKKKKKKQSLLLESQLLCEHCRGLRATVPDCSIHSCCISQGHP